MKEFIEKLISRLEEAKFPITDLKQGVVINGSQQTDDAVLYDRAIEIVNQLAEEYSANTPQNSAVNPTTNADRIRSMNDEELAEFFEKLEVVCDMCAFKVGCCNIAPDNCKSGLLKWLQSEVEGVTENE